jgi:hypothetical protein
MGDRPLGKTEKGKFDWRSWKSEMAVSKSSETRVKKQII